MSEEKLPAAVPVPVLAASASYPLAKFRDNMPFPLRLCTLPVDTPKALALVMGTIERATKRLWDRRGETIEVRDVLVVDSEEEAQETGEMIAVKRMILVTPEGEAYQTPSPSARRSLVRQMAVVACQPWCRIPPYDPPLRVYLMTEKSSNPGRGDWFHPVVELMAPQSGRPKGVR